jgi:hypothetical protein
MVDAVGWGTGEGVDLRSTVADHLQPNRAADDQLFERATDGLGV